MLLLLSFSLTASDAFTLPTRRSSCSSLCSAHVWEVEEAGSPQKHAGAPAPALSSPRVPTRSPQHLASPTTFASPSLLCSKNEEKGHQVNYQHVNAAHHYCSWAGTWKQILVWSCSKSWGSRNCTAQSLTWSFTTLLQEQRSQSCKGKSCNSLWPWTSYPHLERQWEPLTCNKINALL